MKNTESNIKRVFLDTNILLDYLLERGTDGINADNIFEASTEGKIDLLTAAHSITNLSYIARKSLTHQQIKLAIMNFCGLCEVVDINNDNIEKAIKADYDPDFEDSLQIQCAVDSNSDCIVTRDKRGFGKSPIKVQHPSEFLEELQSHV